MKKYFLLFFFFSVQLQAQVSLKKPEGAFDLLVGTWQYSTNPEFESWSKKGNIYLADVYSTAKGDTTISEKIKVFKEKNKYYYELQVVLQKNLPTTRYELIKAENRLFTFENKKQVFPQTITYEFLENNALRVSQGGTISGQYKSIAFVYRKLK